MICVISVWGLLSNSYRMYSMKRDKKAGRTDLGVINVNRARGEGAHSDAGLHPYV